jgi:DnaJ-class molecular chaperone
MSVIRPNSSDDLYAELDLDASATVQDIKRAFRRIAHECHPDVAGTAPEATEHFKRARHAYETLVDPVSRARYDRGGSAGQDPFDGFWSTPRQWNAPRDAGPSGNDLDLEDLFRGFGHFTDFGFGRSGSSFREHRGQKPSGSGRASPRTNAPEAAAAEPPASRQETEAAAGQVGTRADPLPFAISVTEALLGGRVEVATPGGMVRLVVPPCTSSDAIFRVRGKGTSNADGHRDDLFLRARIVAPGTLDEESRALLLQFARLHPYDPRQGSEQAPPVRREPR